MSAPPVLVLGGGITGMRAATVLAELGHPTLLVEKNERLGGQVRGLSRLFPGSGEGRTGDGAEFAAEVEAALVAQPEVDVRLGTTLTSLEGRFPQFAARLSDGTDGEVGAVLVATGYQPFDPTDLEDYGYHRYANVVTAPELERALASGRLRRPSDGKPVSKLAIVFCVGSRNVRIGAPFCSRICCSYSTKQALTLTKQDPAASVTCFYMDIRTYDRGFEEMYLRAQQRGVRYTRGRVSGCKELPGGDIVVRAENTLVQKISTCTFDMVSLAIGMRPCRDGATLAQILGIERAPDGFFASRDWSHFPHDATRDGIFIAGCATGAKPIRDCITDAGAAAAQVATRLRTG